ncbi:hypothetical protein MCOR27_000136 [Pyricularia oryzae]|uniref:Uncharacterized protein n=2 Tax=Pyricularia TaxID=48558 RepID=A0ABQ8NMT1_PYRGI|nr:hypothetical protein MCOR01_006542 [Pyricularia oryzae]KAI6298977.1 hypothetical protein MCOR33_005032 [Pyricularia grisea]KAH9435895.1 hypothetical protein MCOR02_004807 [Pyricularia oryzae]KAI6254392.1 hypothetical protein MCOR19_009106 [Pyricularia oryzae]KAI6269180.1 hypothetical protein MCOR26_008848 [Pyricularia oryzae]
MASPPPPSTSPITLRIPSKYASETPSAAATAEPTLDFLHRTWSVTHSTLAMWRDARNVRITYRPLPPTSDGKTCVDDMVEYEARGGQGGVKSVAGVDTAVSTSSLTAWDWRGKGWLFFVTSHWEVLGWGERPVAGGEGQMERWAVTWFAPTLFTKEGIDIYCDRKEGLSKETEDLVMTALRGIGAEKLVAMVDRDMRPVEIQLPWKL